MSLLRHGLRLSGGGAFRRFEAALADPERAQRETLSRLLASAAGTAFGREHGFSTIRTPEAYARLVPIRDYEGFRPYIQRMLSGEAGVLAAEVPEMYATTSGTTGEPKLLPVTPGWRREMSGLLRLWMLGVLRDHPRCFDGSVLTVVSPAVEGLTASGVPYGAMTGLTQQRAPWLIRRQYATPYEAALVKDYEARYFLLMRLALAKEVTAIVTPNPSTLIRLAGVARSQGDALLRAIHDGTVGIPFPALLPQPGLDPAAAEARLLARLRPDPARARALGKLAEREGALLPRLAWPDLQLIGCWLGGSAGLQARHLSEAYGAAALRDVGLLASEGRMTVPLADGGPEGPLYVHANYYEFIPEAAIDRPAPPVLGVHQLADGERYYMIVTGGNGLYRYDMNDIVEVSGFHARTPRVAFVRKGRDMLNITGEKLHLNQIQAALREAEAEAATAVWQYQVLPDAEASTYDLLVEFKGPAPDEAVLRAFQQRFDSALAGQNEEYAAKRASARLGPPRLHVMSPGWCDRLSRHEVASGKRDAQFKWQPIRQEWDSASRSEVSLTLDAEGRLHQAGCPEEA